MKENRNKKATIVSADLYDRQARKLLQVKGLHCACDSDEKNEKASYFSTS